MRKKVRKLVCFLLVCCMVIPDTVLAAGLSDDTQNTENAQSMQTEETNGFTFESAEGSFSEGDGSGDIQIIRTGDTQSAASVTVTAYDFSAKYAQDYALSVDGEAAAGNADAVSLYDAFKEDGFTVDTQVLAESMSAFAKTFAFSGEETEASGEEATAQAAEDTTQDTEEQLSKILTEVGAKSAEMTLDFAAGQTSAVCTLDLYEDDEPEYTEYFILTLSSESGLGVNWEMTGSITDNEETAPENTITFAKESLEVEEDTGTAELWFQREGAMDVFSTAVLLKDGEPYGYLNFNPYQEEQMANVPTGVYQLTSPLNCQVTENTATVSGVSEEEEKEKATEAQTEAQKEEISQEETRQEETETNGVSEDPNIDQVPKYSALPDSSGASFNASTKGDTSWISEWAKKGSYETEDAYIVVGSSNNQLFHQGGNSGYGHADFQSSDNCYRLDTSGFGSHLSTSHVYVDGNSKEDLTGIGSVTGCFDVANLDKSAQVKLGVNQVASETKKVDINSKGEITCTLPEKSQNVRYIYYENIDPSNGDDGCQVYTLNGYKLNKREYYVTIDTPDALAYSDQNVAATIDGNNARMYKKMGDGKSEKSKISVVYSSPTHPQTLVGYRLVNKSTNKTSDVIRLNASENITFDRAFIKAYEKDYFYTAKDGAGNSYTTLTIKPVMEKIPVESYSLEKSSLGTIKLTNADANDKLYQGDTAVFTADQSAQGVSLEGVYVKARSASNNEWIRWTQYAGSDGKVRVNLDVKYDDYTFQGVYSTDADILTIEYADGAKEHGQLAGQEGVAVQKSEYVINDFYPLTAKAGEGYVTKWTSNGRTYYGDVFYYQLDGNADNNKFTVDFVKEAQETASIRGTMSVTDVNLHNSALSSSHPLEYKEFSTTSGENYTGSSEKDGIFTINNFKGVKGGTYSIAILNEDIYSYLTFTFGDTNSYNLKVPQFGAGIFFPASVSVSLDGAGSSENKIQLREESYVETTVWVYNQVNSPYTIKTVELKYYGEDENGAAANLVQTAEAEKTGKNDGNYTQYISKVSASSLPQDTRLYAEVVGSRTINANGSSQTVEVRSGEVNCGYEFITPIKDTSIPVQQDVPIVPGAQSALSVSLSDLDIPIIGTLDFGVNSKAGAFFVRQPDVNDPSVYYLIAGYSVNAIWGVGTPDDKILAAAATAKMLQQAEKASQKKGDTSETKQEISSTPVNTAGQTQAGEEKEPSLAEKYGLQTRLGIYPLGMIKLGFKTTADATGDTTTKLSLYELVLGVDSHLIINKPFLVYGMPFYATVTINGEQYVQVQQNVNVEKSDAQAGGDLTQTLVDAEETDSAVNSFISIPQLQMGLKGGVGMSNLVGAYLEGVVDGKLLFQMTPDCDAGGSLGFDISVGADVLVLNTKLTFNIPEFEFGDENLYDQLKMFSSKMSAKQKSKMMEEMQNARFSLVERTSSKKLLNSGKITSATLMENAFKHTKVKLIPLETGSIMAVILVDNGAANGSANFLSVAYAISSDQGNTWNNITPVDPSDKLQFGFETYELNDRLLVTWSEGDIDQRLKEMDKSNLNAGQVAQALNEMNLKGCYFDKTTGAAMGEAFTIAENTGVAMSSLSAMEAEDGTVAVYYTRAQYPTEDGTTLQTLMEQEKTIACAVSGPEGNWTSHAVEAQNDSGNKSYRIMEVQAFSYDGITGEVLVLDRDGKLVVTDSASGEMIPDIEDRQIYVRIHTGGTDGTQTSTLLPLTGTEGCAQNIQIVKNENDMYLFWNQDGKIVYLKNFVVSNSASEVDKSCAVAVADQTTNTVTEVKQSDGIGSILAAADSSLKVQSNYSVSLDDGGNVLLSWIAEESQEDSEDAKLFPNDEIYGVVLKETTNGEIKTLESVGNPVALTNENSVLGTLDNIYLSDKNFLLGYSKLDGETMQQSKKAAVCAESVSYEPKLTITDIQAPTYPMPGSEITVQATLRNEGIAPLSGATLKVSGLGEDVQDNSKEKIDPGCEETIAVTLNVPDDFSKDTTLKFTACGLGNESSYAAEKETSVLYGSYFVPQQMARLFSIADTKKYVSELTVANMGNAVGKPEISYDTYLSGSDNAKDHDKQTYQSKDEVAPGESAKVTYTVEDTISTKDQQSQMQITLGDGYDQSVEGVVPAALVSKTDAQKVPECKTHSFKEVVTPATPDKDGSIVEVCSVCGKTGKTTVIARPDQMQLSKKAYTYNGKKKTPTVSIKDREGKTIAPENYTVSYPKGRKKAGKYLVTVTFTGKSYQGQMSQSFKIKPEGTTLHKLTGKKKGFKVTWKKNTAQTSGYEMQYSTSREFTEKTTQSIVISDNKKTKKWITGLKAGQKYFVRIRTCKKKENEYINSKWSSQKKVVTKKR